MRIKSIRRNGNTVLATEDWGATSFNQSNYHAVSHYTLLGSTRYDCILTTYAIEMEPIFDMTLNAPSVNRDGYGMSLRAMDPSSNSGTSDYSSYTNNLKNYFYVSTDTTKTVDEVKADNSIIFTEDGTGVDKSLAPNNTYRVFAYSKYIADNGIEMMSSDITYTDIAVYDNYTITFDANNGQCATPNTTVTLNNTYGTLPTPTRTGYTFNGWYTALSGGTKIESTTVKSVAGDETLYAIWTQNPAPAPQPAPSPSEPVIIDQQEMENVKTEDTTVIFPWIIMLFGGIALLTIGTIKKKKK